MTTTQSMAASTTHSFDQGVGALLDMALKDDMPRALMALQAEGLFAWEDLLECPINFGAIEPIPVQMAAYAAFDCLEALLAQGWTSDAGTLGEMLHRLLRSDYRVSTAHEHERVMSVARRLLTLGATPKEYFADALAWEADLYTDAELALLLPPQVPATAINVTLWSLSHPEARGQRPDQGLVRLLNLLEARGGQAMVGGGFADGSHFPVHAAVKFNLPRVLTWLLEHGADPDVRIDILGRPRTTAHLASKASPEVQQVLDAWREQQSLKRSVAAEAKRAARKRVGKGKGEAVVVPGRRRL